MRILNNLNGIFLVLVLLVANHLQAADSPPPLDSEPEEAEEEDVAPVEAEHVEEKMVPQQENGLLQFIRSAGLEVVVKEKGFSISPPAGWEYTLNYPGTTMLIQAPDEASAKYRRTIQVMSFSNAKYLDEATTTEYQEDIIKRFSSESAVSGYRIRNHLRVDLDSGVQGHLYYAEFVVSAINLMQMHVLVSSADRHFLVTFTDLAESFDTENGNAEHLNEAWTVINSVKLESSAGSPLMPAVKLLFIVALLAGVAVGVRIFINKINARRFSDYASGNFTEGDDSPITKSPESFAPEKISGKGLSISATTIHEGGNQDLGHSEDVSTLPISEAPNTFVDFDHSPRKNRKAS